ncbi:GCN5 family N-acetyltransferase [Ciceribacter naphthalenivorans]|uniref:GCN5 family N-acetyltransferase n=2 Tax=Alphaproteobacteria TaxID=28211 RepID=A0A512HKB9_9HYPH|nr:GCN5 family N-acetyltransferase [Ciceribacter naphthalenivorans]GLR21754.1 GCN5 family N-acetyltransferase [Ciceribacter naphthalenivorans]GLT04610.1 GCN5 family N-acetyltransferase [Sphingomonas psychrolutea]
MADIAAIARIYADAVATGTASYELVAPDESEMQKRFEAITGQGYPYIVAVDPSNQILGYAYASAFRTRPAYRWLVEDSIYLAPEARGRGIGRTLLEELVRRATDLGFRQMVAVIGGASLASIAVHRALGFRMAGTLNGTGFKLGQWLDTVFMQTALGEGDTSDPDPYSYPGTLFAG